MDLENLRVRLQIVPLALPWWSEYFWLRLGVEYRPVKSFKETWYELLVDLEIPNKIQPEEYSTGSAYRWQFVRPTSRSTSGTASATWTATATTTTGMTTGGSLVFATILESYLVSCFCQPPIILPTSEKCCGNVGKFFIVYGLHFPYQLQEKLQHVQL